MSAIFVAHSCGIVPILWPHSSWQSTVPLEADFSGGSGRAKWLCTMILPSLFCVLIGAAEILNTSSSSLLKQSYFGQFAQSVLIHTKFGWGILYAAFSFAFASARLVAEVQFDGINLFRLSHLLM